VVFWGVMAGVRIALGGTPGMSLQEHDRYLPRDNVGDLPVFDEEMMQAPRRTARTPARE